MTGIEADRVLRVCEHFLRFARSPIGRHYAGWEYALGVVDVRQRKPTESAVGIQRDRPLAVGNGSVVLVLDPLDLTTHRVRVRL